MRCLIAGTISSTSIDKRNIGKIINAIKSLRPKAGGSSLSKKSSNGWAFLRLPAAKATTSYASGKGELIARKEVDKIKTPY